MRDLLRKSLLLLLSVNLALISNSCRKRSEQIIVSTAEVRDITQTGLVSGGNIEARRSKSIIARGVCWSTETNPALKDNRTTDGEGAGVYISTLTGLKPVTVYYLRAYAISLKDTSYGDAISFTTQDYGNLNDVDGNGYKTLSIGTQTWMAMNLGTTRLNDGTEIPLISDKSVWAATSSPAFCWYKNDEATYKPVYGALYNGNVVSTGRLCPAGWHVPSDAEWNILTAFLGGEAVAGGKLKEAGTSRWVRPNNGATNSSYFTGLPGGLRYSDGEYHDFGFSGYWWSSTQFSAARAYFRFLYHQDSCIYRFDNVKTNGFSVRCVKDN